jgi:hypothetical protein
MEPLIPIRRQPFNGIRSLFIKRRASTPTSLIRLRRVDLLRRLQPLPRLLDPPGNGRAILACSVLLCIGVRVGWEYERR